MGLRHFSAENSMKALLLATMALYASASIAGSADLGTLNTVHFMSNGVVIAYTTGARSDVPACAVSQSRFSLDATSAAGRAQLAGLLTAYAAGKQVAIVGTGSCAPSGEETIAYFYAQ
jgi:hypothetical protein